MNFGNAKKVILLEVIDNSVVNDSVQLSAKLILIQRLNRK